MEKITRKKRNNRREGYSAFFRFPAIAIVIIAALAYYPNRAGRVDSTDPTAYHKLDENTSYIVLQQQRLYRIPNKNLVLTTDENITASQKDKQYNGLSEMGNESVLRVKNKGEEILTRVWQIPLNRNGNRLVVSFPGTLGSLDNARVEQALAEYKSLPIHERRRIRAVLLFPNPIASDFVARNEVTDFLTRRWASFLVVAPDFNRQTELIEALINSAKSVFGYKGLEVEVNGFSYGAVPLQSLNDPLIKSLRLTELPEKVASLLELVDRYIASRDLPWNGEKVGAKYFIGNFLDPLRERSDLSKESFKQGPPLPSSLEQSQSWFEKKHDFFRLSAEVATLAKGMNVLAQGRLLTTQNTMRESDKYRGDLEFVVSSLSTISFFPFPHDVDREEWVKKIRVLALKGDYTTINVELQKVVSGLTSKLKTMYPNARSVVIRSINFTGHGIGNSNLNQQLDNAALYLKFVNKGLGWKKVN